MSDLIKQDGENLLIDLIHEHQLGINMPIPFEREHFLFDSSVAGTSHIENIEEIGPQLKTGQKLLSKREPDNYYDPQAICVRLEDGQKIGYVPRKDNLVFARLMDAGINLFGKISKLEKRGKWFSIGMRIFLKD